MADLGVAQTMQDMEFMAKQKELELKRIQYGIDEMEFRILTHEREILKTKNDIEISRKTLAEKQNELNIFRQKIARGKVEGMVE